MTAYTSLSAVLYRLHTILSVPTHDDIFINIILSILGTDLETNDHILQVKP